MWALAPLLAEDWIFAIGGLIFILMATLLLKALPQPKSGFLAVLLSPLNLLTSAGVAAVRKINQVFGPATFRPQQNVGAGLHDVARLTDDTAAVLIQTSAVGAVVAEAISGTATSLELAQQAGALTKRIGNAERQAKGIGADVQPRIEAAARGIEAGVNQRVGSLDKALERIAAQDIPNLRARTRATENELSRLWRWAHRNIATVGTLTFAGAVAVALSKLGGGWIRCENWKRIGKSICGIPLGLIEGLLGDLIDVLLIADVCQITKLMIRTAESSLVQDALRGIIVGVDELMLCQGVDLPSPLTGYAAALPPAQAFAALPA